MEDFALKRRRYHIETDEDWDMWRQMSSFRPKAGWELTILPPWGGALVGFLVTKGPASVSIYFDPLGRLGAVDEPYWEMYPSVDSGDVDRFLHKDFDKLVEAIDQALNHQILAKFEIAA